MPVPQAIDAYGAQIAPPQPSLNQASPAPHTPLCYSRPCPCRSASRSAPALTGWANRIQGEHMWEKLNTFGEKVNTFRPSVDT